MYVILLFSFELMCVVVMNVTIQEPWGAKVEMQNVTIFKMMWIHMQFILRTYASVLGVLEVQNDKNYKLKCKNKCGSRSMLTFCVFNIPMRVDRGFSGSGEQRVVRRNSGADEHSVTSSR